MGKLYIINDTPLFGVSRKQRMLGLRREQSGDSVPRPEFPPPPLLPPRDLPDPGDFLVPALAESRDVAPAPRDGWQVPFAYLLGPLAVAAWTTGRTRIVWSVLGGASSAAAVAMFATWPAFLYWTGASGQGVAWWLTAVIGVPTCLFVVWGRAIAAAARRCPVRWPDPLRSAGVTLAAGMIVPGLGFHAAGRPKKAAMAFAALGPLVTALVIQSHSSWLWKLGGSGSAALSPNALEVTFAAAGATTLALVLLWIGHAVHAACLVPAARRQPRTGPLALLMLAVFVLFGATRAGVPLAVYLHDTSTALRGDGFRLIPLGLCQLAAQVDPARPTYLVDVAVLNDALGREDAANAAREMLAERTAEFRAAMAAASARRSAGGDATPGKAWTRIAVLSK